jgi:hypothetical protein
VVASSSDLPGFVRGLCWSWLRPRSEPVEPGDRGLRLNANGVCSVLDVSARFGLQRVVRRGDLVHEPGQGGRMNDFADLRVTQMRRLNGYPGCPVLDGIWVYFTGLC